MTTLNPLGDKPFWFNVYRIEGGASIGAGKFKKLEWAEKMARAVSVPCIYRVRVTPWIPHDGGPCPVGPDVRVRVMFRDKSKSPELTGGLPAGALFWGTIWGSDDRHDDIIAYQIVE